jgi:uncharacterized protein YbcI
VIRLRFYPTPQDLNPLSRRIFNFYFKVFAWDLDIRGTGGVMPPEDNIPIQSPTIIEPIEGDRGGSHVAAISRDIVRVHARFYGRGPTKAKTVWRDEIIVCILEDIFTKAERLLVDGGRFEDVRSHRTAFQDQVEPLLRASVAAVTGRPVQSFLSQVSFDGVASEVFVLGDHPGG